MSRLFAVARLELRLQRTSPVAWALLAAVAFATVSVNPAAMIPSGDAAIGGVRPFANSPHAIAQVFALTGLIFYPLFVSMMAGLSVVRDDEAGIGELVHSTPLSPAEYISGKFAGVAVVLGAVVGIHVAFAMLWNELGWLAGVDRARGPFRLWNYVGPAALLLLPGALFCAGVAFAIGERTRSAFAVYATGAAIFVLTLAALIPAAATVPGLAGVFATLDVWGARWLSATVLATDRGIAFYNHAPLAADAVLVSTRLVAIATTVLAVALATRHCRTLARGTARWSARRLAGGGSSPRGLASSASVEATALASSRAAVEPALITSMFPPSAVAGAVLVARAELRQVLQQPALHVFVVMAALLAWEFGGSSRGVLDAPVLLTPGGLAVGLWELVTALGCLLLMFVLVEALGRARHLGLLDIVHSTPVPTVSLVVGTQMAGLAVAGVLLVACTVACALVLWLQDGRAPAFGPFVVVWGVLLAPTFAFWSALVTLVFALGRHRHTAYVVLLGVLAVTVALAVRDDLTWANNWALWGALRWTDMGVFELDGPVLWANRSGTLVAAAVMCAAAVLTYARVEPDPAGAPARRRRLRRDLAGLGTGALVPALCAVWLHVEIRQGFQGEATRERAAQYWRQNALVWGQVPPPTVAHVEARIRLDPTARRMRVNGAFTVVNDTRVTVTRAPFTVGESFGPVDWSIDGQRAQFEDRSGLHVLTLPVPLAPGVRFHVEFAYEAVVPRGPTRNGGGTSAFILPSGVYLTTLGTDFLPIPGFVEGRAAGDLERPERPAPDDDAWRSVLAPLDGAVTPFTSRLTIDAPDDYTVTSVGEPVSARREGGRTEVTWQNDHPVRFLSLVAGRWAERRANGAAVFFHPAHDRNVDGMLTTLVAARDFYSGWWFPYPWESLTLSEYPDYVSRAQSFPTNIPFSEGMGFLVRPGEPHAAEIVTAHEVAHQWWGHLLVPGRAPGADVLVEGMAHYATLRYLEARHGAQARLGFATLLESQFLEARRVDTERPLARIGVDDSGHHRVAASHKGAWVLWMLEQFVGRTAMDTGLRQFFVEYRQNPDHPALQDLLEVLRRHAPAPEAFDRFVDQWLFGVSLPEIQLRDSSATRDRDGWRVTTTVDNVGTGDASVELAAFGDQHDDAEVGDAPETRTSVHLPGGTRRTVTWHTPFQPTRLVVDPDALVMQVNRGRATAGVGRSE
jgi:ABC-2 type transport system permease protein